MRRSRSQSLLFRGDSDGNDHSNHNFTTSSSAESCPLLSDDGAASSTVTTASCKSSNKKTMVAITATSALTALLLKMAIAAFSGMGAATVCHPLDVIRVQMQTENSPYADFTSAAKGIYQKDGLRDGLFAGISAAYLRQWLYGSCRIGIYAYLLEAAQNDNLAKGLDKNDISLKTKMLMGLTSGGIGSFVGTPSELALVRMSNDKKLPLDQRRNYRGVGNCISRIATEEGLPALFRGAPATVLRACLLSACAMGITSEIKLRLSRSGLFGPEGKLWGGVPLLFLATLVSSLAANTVANPFDVVKSRMQNMKVEKDGSTQYKSMVDCFAQTVGNEGFLKLWSGFVPAFLKLAPYTVISLILTDKITKLVTGKEAL
mmetsp:Transcript_8264/g.17615  ORF Transcript_8264/g.17615 Transcript_8264/m.17615 type:complete len:374 (+) Transcript_8264:53-1174(+)